MENTEKYGIISAQEFLRRLYAGEEIKDIKVNEDIFIDTFQMRGNPITIKSGKFSNFQIFCTLESAKFIHLSILGGDFDCFKILEDVRINKLLIQSGIFTDFAISDAKIDYFTINGGLFEVPVIERTKLLNTTINFGNFPKFTIDNADFGTFIIKKGEFGDFTLSSGIFKIFKVLGGSFSDFVIEDGKFDELEISNGELDIFEMHAGLFLNFRINKCKSTNCFSIEGGEFTGTFTITGEFQNFYINGGEYSYRTCFIIGCTFNFFEISDGNFKNILQIGVEGINSMLFEDKARFIGGIFRTLLFCGGKFKNGLMLSNNIKIQENCKFLGGEYIKPISLNAGIDVSNSIFYFNKNLLVGQIQFSTSFAVKNTYFENNENLLPNLLFENCAIPTGTLIKINETHIENISFINSVNFGNIVFSGVKGTKNKATQQSTLKINNSDLGKTTFIDCDFEEMELDFRVCLETIL